MSLDEQRYEMGLWDLFCCVRPKKDFENNTVRQKGVSEQLFEHIYAPFLLKK